MQYKRMPTEIEAPEGFGYENIDCNLSKSSFTVQKFGDLTQGDRCEPFLPGLNFDNGFSLDTKALENMITEKTKLVSFYPHNPASVMISEDQLRWVKDIIERKNIYLLLDETDHDMSFVKQLTVADTLSDRVISVSSISKSYGLPGIRIGWIFSKNKSLREFFLAAREQIYITNSVVDEEIAFRYLQQKEKYFEPVRQTILKTFLLLKIS